MNELAALVILGKTPYLGSIKIRLLIQRFGSAQEVLETSANAIKELPGFGPKIIDAWGWWKKDHQWQNDLELAQKEGVKIISFQCPDYPKRLLEIQDHPPILYVKGKLTKKMERCVAIIGTRQASIYGKEYAEKIAYDLAGEGYTIVSGLARGIDTAAHQGALKAGQTIGVIGSGLSNLYPRENLALAAKMSENGAIISEFPMLMPPDRQNFPQRNRIVSGMTLGTILIEAPLESGAMITVKKAEMQGRLLFALPHRADHPFGKGNLDLIKSGRAQLVESAHDIIVSIEGPNDLFSRKEPSAPPMLMPLEPEEQYFLNILPSEEANIEKIAEWTKLPMMKLNVLLMSLVLKNRIKEFPGRIYKKSF